MAKKEEATGIDLVAVGDAFGKMFEGMAEVADLLGFELPAIGGTVDTAEGSGDDLDAMTTEEELEAYADSKGIDIPRKCKTVEQMREFIATQLISTGGEDASAASDEIDLDAMDEDALVEFASKLIMPDGTDVDIPRKLKTEKEIRKFVADACEAGAEMKPEDTEKPAKKSGRVEEPDETAAKVRERLQAKSKANKKK